MGHGASMKRFLTFLFVVVASLVEAQGDFVVNYRGLIAGRASTTNGFVDFYRTDTAYKVRIQGPTGLAASRTFTLPATLGTSGQGLSTDGTGAMSWVSFLRSSDIGSTVQAYNVNLGAIAGLTYGANLCTYWTGAGVAATMSCTSAGRSMLGAADAAAQTALLNSFTGDSGSGGVKGLVTAPASGDALKFLRGDATWQTVDTTITHGVTARSGCVAGGVSRSTSNLEDCGAGLTFASGILGITGSATLTNTLSVNLPSGVGSIVGYNLSKTQSATDYGATINFNAGAAGATNLGVLGFTGTSGSGNTIFTAGEIKNALAMNASTAIQFGIGTGTPFVNIESTGVSIIRGTTRIGDSSLGSTIVPLTARLGTGSTANVFEMQNSAGTVLSKFDSLGALLVPANGGTGIPSIQMGSANYGFIQAGDGFYFRSTGVYPMYVGATLAAFVSGLKVGWSSSATDAFTAADLILSRASAATLQLGNTITSGSAINQTFRSHNATTGTDISGGNLTIAAPGGTGSSTGGTIAFQTAPVLASGTTAQTPVDRVIIPKSGGLQLVTGTKPTCDSSTGGTMFRVAGGAGVADTMEVCAKSSADAYAWYPMATIP